MFNLLFWYKYIQRKSERKKSTLSPIKIISNHIIYLFNKVYPRKSAHQHTMFHPHLEKVPFCTADNSQKMNVSVLAEISYQPVISKRISAHTYIALSLCLKPSKCRGTTTFFNTFHLANWIKGVP